MKWHKLAALTIAVVIMLTIASPAMAQRGNHRATLIRNIATDIAPYDRITGYNFRPTQDYNRDGRINAYDSFIEFHHHQAGVVIVELGILAHWQSSEASYRVIQLEGCGQGYNRFYSAELCQLNLSVNAVYIVGHSTGHNHFPNDTIDNLDTESLAYSAYPIVDYSGTTEYMGFHLWENDLGLFDPRLESYVSWGFRRPLLTLTLQTDCEDGFTDTVKFLIRVIDLDTGMEYTGQFDQTRQMRDADFALFGDHTAIVRIWNMEYLPNSARVELYSWWGSAEPFYWCQWGI